LPRETAATLGALIRAVESGELHAQIKLVVSDNPEAYCLERARQARLSCFTFYPRKYPDKATYEGLILRQLRELNVEYIVLAGYMRLIGPTLLAAFPERIINIHPSLLPAFPGKDAIGQALAAGVPAQVLPSTTWMKGWIRDPSLPSGRLLSIRVRPGKA